MRVLRAPIFSGKAGYTFLKVARLHRSIVLLLWFHGFAQVCHLGLLGQNFQVPPGVSRLLPVNPTLAVKGFSGWCDFFGDLSNSFLPPSLFFVLRRGRMAVDPFSSSPPPQCFFLCTPFFLNVFRKRPFSETPCLGFKWPARRPTSGTFPFPPRPPDLPFLPTRTGLIFDALFTASLRLSSS